jgi:hypothetical protein
MTLTQAEIAEWAAYFCLNPFGEDIQHLMIAKVLGMVSGKAPSVYMPKVVDGAVDPDMAHAEAFLKEEIRLGNC